MENDEREIGVGKFADLQERVSLKKANREELYLLDPPFPKTNFLMELSNACNHACIFCAHQKMHRKVGRMNKQFAFDILQQAYDLGTREVGFYATGEPFLINDLADYVAKAKDIGYTYVYLTSNGSLATPERVRPVLEAGLDSLKFSINAPQRDLYEFIHGYDHFETVCENLRWIHDYRQERGLDFALYVTGILTRYTEDLQNKWHEVFGDICDQVVFKYVYNQGGYMPEIDDYLRCRCDMEATRRCNLPFDAICVTCEGYLSVENADYENMLTVADLKQVSLADGWYGDAMREMRRRFIEDDLKGTLCYGCVHHCKADSTPLDPAMSTLQHWEPNDTMVRERISQWEMRNES